MKREDFIKLQIGQIIYNKKSYDIVVMESQYTTVRLTSVNDNDYLTIKGLDDNDSFRIGLKMGEYDDWELISEEAPDKIMLKLLKIRLSTLEKFVYGRLK
jgi:hypothetical protein